jgi:hypothetical protein
VSPTVLSLLLLCGIDGSPSISRIEPVYEAGPVLTDEIKKKLDSVIRRAQERARPRLDAPARTLAEAQRLALRKGDNVDDGMTWAVEYRGYYVFAHQTHDGEPMLWFYGVVVRKDSKDVCRFGSW